MSSFEIQGNVESVENKTSQKGAAFVTFKVKDSNNSIFELSLFGDSMTMSSKLKGQVSIKGVLKSREYNGKNYPDFRVSWIEAVEKSKTVAAIPAVVDELDGIPF